MFKFCMALSPLDLAPSENISHGLLWPLLLRAHNFAEKHNLLLTVCSKLFIRNDQHLLSYFFLAFFLFGNTA